MFDEFLRAMGGIEIWKPTIRPRIARMLDKETYERAARLERELEEERRKGRYDTLSPNLLNARGIEEALGIVEGMDVPVTVAVYDLDGLKAINDTYGHTAGDTLLATVGDRLHETSRDGDLVARMHGDEYLTILPDVDEVTVAATMDRIGAALIREPAAINCYGEWREMPVSVSAGVSIYQKGEASLEETITAADAVLQQAKPDVRGDIPTEPRFEYHRTRPEIL